MGVVSFPRLVERWQNTWQEVEKWWVVGDKGWFGKQRRYWGFPFTNWSLFKIYKSKMWTKLKGKEKGNRQREKKKNNWTKPKELNILKFSSRFWELTIRHTPSYRDKKTQRLMRSTSSSLYGVEDFKLSTEWNRTTSTEVDLYDRAIISITPQDI